MITIFQEQYIKELCENIGTKIDVDISKFTKEQAHEAIQKLLDYRNEVLFDWYSS